MEQTTNLINWDDFTKVEIFAFQGVPTAAHRECFHLDARMLRIEKQYKLFK